MTDPNGVGPNAAAGASGLTSTGSSGTPEPENLALPVENSTLSGSVLLPPPPPPPPQVGVVRSPTRQIIEAWPMAQPAVALTANVDTNPLARRPSDGGIVISSTDLNSTVTSTRGRFGVTGALWTHPVRLLPDLVTLLAAALAAGSAPITCGPGGGLGRRASRTTFYSISSVNLAHVPGIRLRFALVWNVVAEADRQQGESDELLDTFRTQLAALEDDWEEDVAAAASPTSAAPAASPTASATGGEDRQWRHSQQQQYQPQHEQLQRPQQQQTQQQEEEASRGQTRNGGASAALDASRAGWTVTSVNDDDSVMGGPNHVFASPAGGSSASPVLREARSFGGINRNHSNGVAFDGTTSEGNTTVDTSPTMVHGSKSAVGSRVAIQEEPSTTDFGAPVALVELTGGEKQDKEGPSRGPHAKRIAWRAEACNELLQTALVAVQASANRRRSPLRGRSKRRRVAGLILVAVLALGSLVTHILSLLGWNDSRASSATGAVSAALLVGAGMAAAWLEHRARTVHKAVLRRNLWVTELAFRQLSGMGNFSSRDPPHFAGCARGQQQAGDVSSQSDIRGAGAASGQTDASALLLDPNGGCAESRSDALGWYSSINQPDSRAWSPLAPASVATAVTTGGMDRPRNLGANGAATTSALLHETRQWSQSSLKSASGVPVVRGGHRPPMGASSSDVVPHAAAGSFSHMGRLPSLAASTATLVQFRAFVLYSPGSGGPLSLNASSPKASAPSLPRRLSRATTDGLGISPRSPAPAPALPQMAAPLLTMHPTGSGIPPKAPMRSFGDGIPRAPWSAFVSTELPIAKTQTSPFSAVGDSLSNKDSSTIKDSSSIRDSSSIIDVEGGLRLPTQLLAGDDAITELRVPPAAVDRVLVIIGLDEAMNVCLWNSSAVACTGLSAREAMRRHIDLVLCDSSIPRLRHMCECAHKGLGMPTERLRLISLTHGTCEIRACVSTATMRSPNPRGTAGGAVPSTFAGTIIMGHLTESTDRSNAAFLARYRNAELVEEMRLLGPLLPMEAQPRFSHCLTIALRGSWEIVSHNAPRIVEWEAASPEALLSDIARLHMARCQIDVLVRPGLIVDCDVPTAMAVLMQMVGLTKDRCQLTLREAEMGPDMIALEAELIAHVPFENPEAVQENQTIMRGVDILCGSLWMPDPSTMILRFPVVDSTSDVDHSRRDSVSSENGTMVRSVTPSALPAFAVSNGSLAATGGSNANFGAPTPTVLTFILYENNALFRHTACTALWSLGHALCVVGGPVATERTLHSGLRDIHGAIVDLDGTKNSQAIIRILLAVPNVSLFFCGDSATPPSSFTAGQGPYFQKPLRRKQLEEMVERVTRVEKDRKGREREVEEKRRIFAMQRSSPWVQGAKLGSGSNADVFEAESVLTGGKMAVKMIYFESLTDERVKEMMNEIDIMCTLTHPNVVHYFHCEKGPRSVNLFMELCPDGTLQNLLQRRGSGLEPYEATSLLMQVLEAVAYLHEKGIVHRDIKPANVLMRDGKAKLSDFGTAAKMSRGSVKGTVGTFRYMAPEVLLGLPQGTACDIWAVGIMALELLGTPAPFLKGCTPVSLCALYASLPLGSTPALPSDLRIPDARNFAALCLAMSPEDRPTARSLLLHPFLTAESQAVTTLPTFRRGGNSDLSRGGSQRRLSQQSATAQGGPSDVLLRSMHSERGDEHGDDRGDLEDAFMNIAHYTSEVYPNQSPGAVGLPSGQGDSARRAHSAQQARGENGSLYTNASRLQIPAVSVTATPNASLCFVTSIASTPSLTTQPSLNANTTTPATAVGTKTSSATLTGSVGSRRVGSATLMSPEVPAFEPGEGPPSPRGSGPGLRSNVK